MRHNGGCPILLFLTIKIIEAIITQCIRKVTSPKAKVAPVNLFYGSHFSATEATYKELQNMGRFVEFTRTLKFYNNYPLASPSIKYNYIVVSTFSPF